MIFLKNDAELKREIRVAPKILISLWVTPFMPIPCDLFLRKENYGFLIESQEMAEMMKRQFEIIWSVSKVAQNQKPPAHRRWFLFIR